MTFDPKPWFIGLEGVKHSAEVARMLAWSATNGASGIITPTDLRVRALNVPGGGVRIAPGGFVVESKYAGASQQSYMGRAPTETTIDIPATGSSGGATRYIVARINDPDYPGGGDIPADPNSATYALPVVVSSLSSSRTEIPLAKIKQPANTGTITQSMITDLREVANPRTLPVNRSRPLNLADVETLSRTDPTGERFPDSGGGQNIDIPTWATRAIIETRWLQVNEPSGNAYGAIWVEYGPLDSGGDYREYSTQRFLWNTGASNDSARNTWDVSDDVYIPKALRGTSQVFSMRGYLKEASSNAARPQMDQHSGIVFKVTFLEAADPSDT